jgi:hypothetical protein
MTSHNRPRVCKVCRKPLNAEWLRRKGYWCREHWQEHQNEARRSYRRLNYLPLGWYARVDLRHGEYQWDEFPLMGQQEIHVAIRDDCMRIGQLLEHYNPDVRPAPRSNGNIYAVTLFEDGLVGLILVEKAR